MNQVFRIYRYTPDYPAFTGRDMTPGGYIELYPSGVGYQDSRSSSVFLLDQNYPNPVKSSTVISFELFVNTHVSLKIRDITGREVLIIVDGIKVPGRYQIPVDMSSFSAGIYFYSISAGGISETKRLVIVH